MAQKPGSGRRGGPAWVDERKDERGDLRVLQGMAGERSERVYRDASECPACAAARAAEGRDDALCDAHLEDALGLGGGWALGPPGRKL